MHSPLFPNEWNVAECLTEHFCNETKKDLVQILARDENDDRFETKAMLAGLEVTIDFEAKINMRFNHDQVSNSANQLSVPKESKYYKIISSCFDAYLWHYVDMEDKIMAEKMDYFRTEIRVNEDEFVLTSSTELFLFYRQTLVNCSRLSTKKVFLDLVKMYQKWLDFCITDFYYRQSSSYF